ncbi:MAG: VCBS domain-containing protein, partial [Desulfomicrobium sp.]|nr:VCBS domain-containing protein [Desulfomicrobium sp.]
APGEVTIKLEGIGEFTVESAGEVPVAIAQGPEIQGFKTQPTIVFETVAAELTDSALTHEALGVHQARVDSTAFLDRQVSEDFGMSQLLDMATFSAVAGDALTGRKAEEEPEQDNRPLFREPELVNNAPTITGDTSGSVTEDVTEDATSSLLVTTGNLKVTDPDAGQSYFRPESIRKVGELGTLSIDADGNWRYEVNNELQAIQELDSGDRLTEIFTVFTADGTEQEITITINGMPSAPVTNTETLTVNDDENKSLTGSLLTTDVDSTPEELTYSIHDKIAYEKLFGDLLLDGNPITDLDHAFTQQDIDDNRLTYKLTPTARVGEAVDFSKESFTFTVSDGVNTTDEQTFDIQNTVVQVWGTDNADSGLKTLTNYDDPASRFHVYGFKGDDFLRGGSNGDTLDGGYGSDLVDYSASKTWVNVDLNLKTAQSGGGLGNHAEGDVLIDIENLYGTNDKRGDVLIGNDENNRMYGDDGNDTLIGGLGNDTLWGGADADSLDGGAGQDDLYGDNGADQMDGGEGHDFLYGGDGNDTIYGGSGNDRMWGESGDDSLVGHCSDDSPDGYADTLYGGAGNDTLDGSKSTGGSTLCGGTGADRIMGNGVSSLASYEHIGIRDRYRDNPNAVYVDLRLQGPDADGNLQVQPGKPRNPGEEVTDDATGDILTGIVHLAGS